MFALCNKTMLTFGAWNCEITKVLSRRKLPKKSRLRKELQSRKAGGILDRRIDCWLLTSSAIA